MSYAFLADTVDTTFDYGLVV